MTREDCYKILVLLQAAYPRFYANKEKSELKNAVNLWAAMFREESAETVALAVKFLIANNTFPPSIAEIKQCIVRSQTKDKMDEIQAWQLVRRALANSGYSPKEEYAKLPPEIQRAVGSPVQLYKWSMLDASEVESFISRDFMRNYSVIMQREREYLGAPRDVRQMFFGGGENDVKFLNGKKLD